VKRRLKLVAVLTVLAALPAAACGSQAPSLSQPVTPPPEIGPPARPADALPAGPVGYGTVLYRGYDSAATLVVADGRRFELPKPPAGEGRQGSLLATLSPDGRWLGLRTARYPRDPGYQVRDLLGGGATMIDGEPVRWSTDSRFLLVRAGERLTLVEPGIGEAHAVTIPANLAHLVTGVFPDGRLLTAAVRSDEAEFGVVSGDGVRRVRHVFASSEQDECWCPVSGLPVLSVDRAHVYVAVAYRPGAAKATPVGATAIAVVDLATGVVDRRIDAPAGELVGDIAAGLVMVVRHVDRTEVVLINAAIGGGRTLTTVPATLTIAVPGQVLGRVE